MASEQIMAMVREKIGSIQSAINDNKDAIREHRAEMEERLRRITNLETFIEGQEKELITLKQWLLQNGAEDVN